MMEILFADRSDRGKLRFTGPQRAWFLHQILTQAFEDMQPGDARDAALLTVHGRMVGYMETLATEDAILAHFEPELRAGLVEAIERYVLATRVEVSDVTEEQGLILLAGDGWDELAEGRLVHPTRSLGIPAGYLWVQADDVNAVLADLESRAERATEEQLEAIRIEHGVPRWGRDMDAKTIPQEVGIDAAAVQFDKGCYVGQEAMAKIHFRGKVNRRLVRLNATEALRPGADVLLDDAKVGTVTSASNGRALAVVRYSVEAGQKVRAGSSEAEVVD